jgi:putative sigma-54 modulation protein
MAVQITIHGRDLSITPNLREYVEKKVGKLDHYLPSITEARIDLAEVPSARSAADRHVAQLTVHGPGMVLRAEERKDDLFTAIDEVMEKMHRQIERYKGKHMRGRGNGVGVEAVVPAAEEEAPEEPRAGRVVRRKRFVMTPMGEAEAIEQMQLLSHEDFFVFYNAETSRVNVLYRRNDGDLGLIDPEIG